MNWKLWAQGLAAAAIGGAGGGFTQAVTTNGGHINGATGICAGVGALLTAVAYILKSPLTGTAPAAPAAPVDPATPGQPK